jgi:hypothetical protein
LPLRHPLCAGNLYGVTTQPKKPTQTKEAIRPRTYLLPADVRRIIDSHAIDLDASPSAALAAIVRGWQENLKK